MSLRRLLQIVSSISGIFPSLWIATDLLTDSPSLVKPASLLVYVILRIPVASTSALLSSCDASIFQRNDLQECFNRRLLIYECHISICLRKRESVGAVNAIPQYPPQIRFLLKIISFPMSTWLNIFKKWSLGGLFTQNIKAFLP